MWILSRIRLSVLRMLLSVFLRLMSLFTKMDSKLILFSSFTGKSYSDNPKYLFEAMLDHENFSDYRFVWAMNQEQNIESAEVVKFNSLKYYYLLSKAKYWVFNAKMAPYYFKRKEQVYLQTWHGTPLKRLAHDLEDTGIRYYRSRQSHKKMLKGYDDDSRHWDFLLSANSFSSEAFSSAFNFPQSKMLEMGYPRVDALLSYEENDVLNLKRKYALPLDKKIILYAPTWRDNSFSIKGYTFELSADFSKWKERLGEDYVLLFKPHYLISNVYQATDDLSDFVYRIDAQADINEAYLMSDILITDYSSVFFDFAILNRPIYFYMPDFDEYKEELRGFYLKVPEDLPNDIAQTENHLLEMIVNKKFDRERLNKFNSRFNLWNDGNASKKIIRRIFIES